MEPNAVNDTTTGKTATHDESLIGSSVLEDAQSLWHELHALIHDHFRLAVLETRRAGESLVIMIVAGVMVAVLLNGAWLGLMAAVVLSFIEHGMVASSAILLAVAFSLLLVLILCGVIRHKSHYLQFPSILRSLQPTSPRCRDTDKSS